MQMNRNQNSPEFLNSNARNIAAVNSVEPNLVSLLKENYS